MAQIRKPLTPRQIAVMDLVIRGWSNRAIAGTLNMGVSTVKTHITDSLEKLGARSREGMRRGSDSNT